MADSEEAKPNTPQLPMVVSPKLDGSDEDAASAFAAAADVHAAPADDADPSLSRWLRFALLAVSVAAAAALGSFVGALSASGVNHLWSAAASPNTTIASTLQAAKAQLAELAALKANLDGATRGANGQFAKLADRLDRVERVQIEAATKVAHIADAVDRLEKKSVTASIVPPAAEITGSIPSPPPAEAKPADKVLPDWIVQDVRAGHALVENSRGGVFNVAAGGFLPGLGRAETIKRQDGQWIVVTARGLITEHNN